jgi:hypothetical protein
MDAALAREVRRRAQDTCEYCLIPQAYYPAPFQNDHIIALHHGGPTVWNNLALACLHCNSHKGTNIAGLDPKTRKLTRLFNPRRQKWSRHFRWEGHLLVGRTPVGRTTITVLNMNGSFLVKLREALIAERLFPPA